jgi:CheY-like chemotaxis protein
MKTKLAGELASSILKNVSAGLALFGDDFRMSWCNQNFKKQTWFGGAAGGKHAQAVDLFDLFEKKDHPAVLELFNIASHLGQAYDFQRMVRRGPMGSFPAELKFHRHDNPEGKPLICIEIRDLSLNKLYDELEASHSSMRERMADLMTAQAELHYSVRMNTISEIGADMAHSLINPVTMCRDILEKEIGPHLGNVASATSELDKVFRYLKNIEELAVWFRKFSNPRLSDMQISNVASLVEDTLILNMNRFSRLGVQTEVDRKSNYNPFVLAVPVNLIMWLNAAFAELSGSLPQGNGRLKIHLHGNADTVQLAVSGELSEGTHERLLPHTLEKFARRLPASARFIWEITPVKAKFELQMACFAENEKDEAARHLTGKEFGSDRINSFNQDFLISRKEGEAINPRPLSDQRIDGPCVLIVDDEKDIRRLLKRTFRNLGIESLEAANGKEALNYFVSQENSDSCQKIRVIISDVRMPEMSGIHLYQELRQRGCALPFVFFSSNLVDSAEIGADENTEGVYILTKDSDLERLKNLVIAYLSS